MYQQLSEHFSQFVCLRNRRQLRFFFRNRLRHCSSVESLSKSIFAWLNLPSQSFGSFSLFLLLLLLCFLFLFFLFLFSFFFPIIKFNFFECKYNDNLRNRYFNKSDMLHENVSSKIEELQKLAIFDKFAQLCWVVKRFFFFMHTFFSLLYLFSSYPPKGQSFLR